MRQMSPASTSCSQQHACRPRRSTLTTPSRGDLEGLVVRAVFLGLLRHQADVRHAAHRRPDRTRRAPCSRRSPPGRRRRSSGRESSPWCPAARRAAFHILPESRIIAGIDASMITSLGTCRLVMPLSELTIASARARRVFGGDVGLDRRALRLPAALADRAYRSPMPLFGIEAEPTAARRRASSKHVLVEALTTVPNMIGSETFIIVAFRCSENSTPCRFASSICASTKSAQRARAHHGRVDQFAGLHRRSSSFSTRVLPSLPVIRCARCRPARSARTVRCRRNRRASMCATWVFESALHAPIRCGCLRAYFFTDSGARRSELPSRSTGFTALPLSLS